MANPTRGRVALRQQVFKSIVISQPIFIRRNQSQTKINLAAAVILTLESFHVSNWEATKPCYDKSKALTHDVKQTVSSFSSNLKLLQNLYLESLLCHEWPYKLRIEVTRLIPKSINIVHTLLPPMQLSLPAYVYKKNDHVI